MKHNAYLDLEEAVSAWCQGRPDILATVVIGSRGRQPPAPDPHSDLDLMLFCQDTARYQNDHTWLNNFGEVWIAALNFVGPRHPEWMAYLAPGLKVDFLFVPADPGKSLAEMLNSLPYPQVLSRGFRILYRAPAAAGESISTAARPGKRHIPSISDFQQKVNATLLTTERFVKFSIRGDDWRSRFTYEAELKSHLLTFIEWHAQTGDGPAGDTWYEGRHMAAWADSRAIEAIPQLDPGHNQDQRQAALTAFLDLFQLLAGEIAARLGYDFPTPGQRKMMAWLQATMRDPAS